MDLVKQLVKKGILGEKEATTLKYQIESSGKNPEEVILEQGLVSEDFLWGLKSKELKIPLEKITPEEVKLEVLELIPEDSARHYKMVALIKRGAKVEVGMVYPEDLEAQEALKFLARQGNFKYQIFLITPSLFKEVLKRYRTLKGEVSEALTRLQEELKPKRITPRRTEETEFARLAEQAPISKVVAVILKHAVEGGASDVHIEPTEDQLRVRFRTNGILHSSIFLPMRIHSAVVARIKILAKLKLDETRIPQDGRFSSDIGGAKIDFRVSTFPTVLGEKVAIRILDPREGLKSFEELGLSGISYKLVREEIKRPTGSIFVTGPTGSGKTTTLYALLQILNKEGVNIVTLEDPVEYFIKGINQSQVKPEIGYTFANGLRHIVRQDPDIVMVGEVRDEETANLVTHAALTGHLVLSTLHTNNVLGVVPRLIDLGVKPYLISAGVRLAIAQRLVRRLCPYCKKKVKAKGQIKKLIQKEIQSLPPSVKKEVHLKKTFYIYEATGCKRCNFKGYSGRIGIFEVLKMTDQLAKIISTKPSEERIKKEFQRQGMITMRQDGILKALSGIVSVEDVIRVTEEEK